MKYWKPTSYSQLCSYFVCLSLKLIFPPWDYLIIKDVNSWMWFINEYENNYKKKAFCYIFQEMFHGNYIVWQVYVLYSVLLYIKCWHHWSLLHRSQRFQLMCQVISSLCVHLFMFPALLLNIDHVQPWNWQTLSPWVVKLSTKNVVWWNKNHGQKHKMKMP